MKWYNKKAYEQHVKDLEFLDMDDESKKLCLKFVRQVAGAFDLTYPRIGILDINDLIQEGYVSALDNWHRLNWDAIKKAPEDEWQPIVWSYIKRGIQHSLGNSIAKHRDTIRIPAHYYFLEKSYGAGDNAGRKGFNTDIFLSRTFSSFFDEDYAESLEYQGESYQNEQLNLFLNDIMDEFLDQMTKQVVKMFYGIDENNDTPKPFKEMSDWLRKPPATIRKIKQRGLDKLKKEEVTEQIEKYLLDTVTN